MILARYTPQRMAQLATRFARSRAEDVLDWALGEFDEAIGYACSFGADGMVLIDMLARNTKPPHIFTLDTGRLPEETHRMIETTRARYGLDIEVFTPKTAMVQQMVSAQGPNLFYHSVENRKRCCYVRKVEPLGRALRGLDAWITGLRRTQAPSRNAISKVELDDVNGGIVKVMPLADWTWDDVWDYIRKNDVPYNPLHDRGYASIGCAPCTRAVEPGEDIRAGRWWWERNGHKECGLHSIRTVVGEAAVSAERV